MENTVKIKVDNLVVKNVSGYPMTAEVHGIVLNPDVVCKMMESTARCTASGAPLVEVIQPNSESRKDVPSDFVHGIPNIFEVLYKNDATIIKWADGTKTYAVCGEGETYDPYTGFMAAVMKKLFGSTGAAKAMLKKKNLEEKAKKEKEAAIKKAEKDAVNRAKWEAENAERIAARKAKMEQRHIDKIAEKMRIEMLAREQAEKMIENERRAQCSGLF